MPFDEDITENEEHFPFPQKTVRIQCGADIYDRWIKEKRFYLRPPSPGPREFDVHYSDTGGSPGSPVVVVIHGAPGCYEDYTKLMRCLDNKGIRVIIPKFPRCPDHIPPTFRHSTAEKCAYFEAFLKAIGIKKIDCLVSHSSGVYVLIRFCLRRNFEVKSITLLSPAGFELMKSIEPYWILLYGVFVIQFPGGYRFLRSISKFLLTLMGSILDRKALDDIILSGTTMVHSGFSKMEGQFRDLANLKLPMLIAWSDDDKLIQAEVFEKITQTMGVTDPDHYWLYDQEGLLEQKGKVENGVKVLAFRSRSHFLFKRQPAIVATEMEELLRRSRIAEGVILNAGWEEDLLDASGVDSRSK